jgi:hypothetical protein
VNDALICISDVEKPYASHRGPAAHLAQKFPAPAIAVSAAKRVTRHRMVRCRKRQIWATHSIILPLNPRKARPGFEVMN